MEQPKNDRLTELVDVAFGLSSAEVPAADQPKLDQIRKVARAIQERQFQAPEDVLARAYQIIAPKERRHLLVQVVRTTIGLAGARLEQGDETQIIVDAEGTRVRMMYGREAEGWSLFGKIEGDGWVAECAGQQVDCGQTGRFKFLVPEVGETRVRFYSDSSEFYVKPFEELVSGV